MQNKTLLITGGARGIGAGICKKFASLNYNIIFTYLNNDKAANNIVEYCSKYSVSCEAHKLDIADISGIQKLTNSIKQKYEHLDVLINNAYHLVIGNIETVTENEFDISCNANIKGVFFTTKYSLEIMKEGSRIINIGSIFGQAAPFPDLDLYSMSKFALEGLTRAWARTLAAKKINVNCIQPGPVDTDLNPKDSEYAKKFLPRLPTARYSTTEEIAELAAFLCGPNTDNITGSCFTNDGGFTA